MLLTVKSNQKILHRQIRSQFQGKRKIPFTATDYEKRHSRDTTWTLRAKEAPDHIKANWPGCSWIVEVITTGTRKGKQFTQTHTFLTRLPLRQERSPLGLTHPPGVSSDIRFWSDGDTKTGPPGPRPQDAKPRHGEGAWARDHAEAGCFQPNPAVLKLKV